MTVSADPRDPLRIGVAGLGRAFTIMLPTFRHDARVQLVAAADPSALAAAAGKHVLVEKPMAITLQECQAMVDACAQAGVHMIVGHSHSFAAPVLRLRALIRSGRFGRVRMIHAMNYTDFLYRPRRPEELDTRAGGGVVLSQGAHQIDIVRCEAADLRPTATGIEIFADRQRLVETLPPPQIPRTEVIDELVAAVRDGQAPLHSGAWALATTEACLAILESARTGTECLLRHQIEASAP